MALVLLLINVFFAWRYAKMPVESDFASFNMWGMTGAVYGRDFVDCKSPLVHLWMLLLSKVKRDIVVIRLLHFLVTGLPSIIYYAVTKDFAGALAFLVLVHSGWLLTFHGNVGDIPAGLIFLALVMPNPWLFVLLLGIATLYEPKLIVATGLMVLLRIVSVWQPVLVYGIIFAIGAGLLFYENYKGFAWIIESSFTIPKRLVKARKGHYGYMPQHTATAFMFFLPWLAAGIYSKPDPIYWLPAIVLLVFQFAGSVIRANHLIPLIAWIAASGIKPELAYTLVLIDFLSAGLYIGNIWNRFYPGLDDVTKDSVAVGNWLKDKPGILWVNSMWTQLYLYAQKKPIYGMTEMIEVNRVVPERRKIMRDKIKKQPPDWIAVSHDTNVEYDYTNYEQVAKSGYFAIYKRRAK